MQIHGKTEPDGDRVYVLAARRATLKTYGLTYEQYSDLLTAQEGLCAICHQPETAALNGQIKRLAVDHNKVTKKVRGLLCQRCNMAVGHLKEDPRRARALAAYLEEHDD